MRWKYRKISESGTVMRYAYSRESDELDGIIEYDKNKRTVIVVKL